jgi:hypothetical protein
MSNLSTDFVIFGYQARELKVLNAKFKLGNKAWILPG